MSNSTAPTVTYSVVVPVHNEEENIAFLVDELIPVLDALPGASEIIYVDDRSTDGTLERLREVQARVGDRLRILCHAQRCGKSAGLITAIAAARGEIIITMDGDGQDDSLDIPSFLAALAAAENPDQCMVVGWRQRRRDNWVRRLSSRMGNGVRSRLLADGTPDTACGLKVFTRAAFMAMPHFDNMHRFLPALMIRAGGTVISREVNHRPRHAGQAKYGVWNRLWVSLFDLVGMMWLQRRPYRGRLRDDVPSDLSS